MKQNPIAEQTAVLHNKILDALGQAVAVRSLPAEPIPAFVIEIPAVSSHGDFASNVAMASARAFQKNPREIANIIGEHLDFTGTYFEKWEIAGPGFLNFYLKPDWFGSVLQTVLTEGTQYGRSDFGNGARVMVEYISANPTGPMHIGNARGGAIGDSLSGILDWAGYTVTREFYVNDAGNQIEKFATSLDVRYQQLYRGQDAVTLPEDAYQGKDIIERVKEFAKVYQDSYLEKDETARKKALISFALPRNIADIKQALQKYRVEYDVWFYESKLHQEGIVQHIVAQLTENGHTFEKDGAIWFRSTAFGCEKDDVLVRESGTPTYFAADIAYHYNKFSVRDFSRVIDIWGADHHGHVQRLKGGLEALGIDSSRLDVVLMQMVRLLRDGEPIKVSKRTGKSITLMDLLDEIPVDAACYFFNLREPNSHFDFDLDLAIAQNAENPVYYVQYAHARICSILKNLKSEGFTPSNQGDYAVLNAPEELELIRHMAKLPNEILEAAQQYNPAKMTTYAHSLAALFHKFYNVCPVKGNDEGLTQARLNLCYAVKVVLCNVLSILKITAPEKM